MHRCGAKTRSGDPCKNWPTRYNGQRCRMHGGAPGSGRPPVHGRYSAVLKGQLLEAYRQAGADELDVLDVGGEIVLIRALIIDHLARCQGKVGAEDAGRLIAWLAEVTKAANRLSQIESRAALTVRQVQLLEVVIVRVLAEFLTPAERVRFGQRLQQELGIALSNTENLSGAAVLPERGLQTVTPYGP